MGSFSTDDKNLNCSRKKQLQFEHISMDFNCPAREWAKWVSELVNRASKQSKRSAAECWSAAE